MPPRTPTERVSEVRGHGASTMAALRCQGLAALALAALALALPPIQHPWCAGTA